MIDYFALALGHGLLAIALLRLVMREGLDDDPLIGSIKSETAENRKATSMAGRNAARRARQSGGHDSEGAASEGSGQD
jgi:hypothetical protein